MGPEGILLALVGATGAVVGAILARSRRPGPRSAPVKQATPELAEGLERERRRAIAAEERARLAVDELGLLLENVEQGLVFVAPSGEVLSQRSAVVDRWFGAPAPGARFWDWIYGPDDASRGAYLSFAWSELSSGDLLLERALDRLPKRHCTEALALNFAYRPILGADGRLARLLVIITDTSEAMARDRADHQHRETMAVAERSAHHPDATAELFDRIALLVTQVRQQGGALPFRLHSLRGEAAVLGLSSIEAACEAVEAARAAGSNATAEIEALRALWTTTMARLRPLVQSVGTRHRIGASDLELLRSALADRCASEQIQALIDTWNLSPAAGHLREVADHAQRLAERMDKDPLEVRVEDHGVRLDARASRELWSTLVHLVRNAVDHGVEPPAERLSKGKSPAGTLRLSAAVVADRFVLEVEDDGRGIDWGAVKARARAMGLAHQTPEELERALFAEGLSTRATPSAVSGWGVGLGAVRAAVEATGGKVEIWSEPGEGMRIRLSWPAATFQAIEPARLIFNEEPPALSMVMRASAS